ncbi:MAG TPA: hypothetical protein VJ865_14980 [Gemmatimonadaceae bacterium]|nr:hypothetical protein [Gemmatimonadaceae bacterium]
MRLPKPLLQLLRRRLRGRFVWVKKPFARAYRQATGDTGYMDWSSLIRKDAAFWENAVSSSASGPRVLIGASLGRYPWEVNFDSTLAVALTLRGARVHVLLCDAALPGCTPFVLQNIPPGQNPATAPPPCELCFPPARAIYNALGLPQHRISELITADEADRCTAEAAALTISEIETFTQGAVSVGEHAVAGAIRFFGNADLASEPHAEPILRRYFEAALRCTYAVQRLLATHEFRVASGSHGIYVPQGIVGEVARSRNVRVVNWHQAYRQKCLLFSDGNTYHKTLLHESSDAWQNIPWTDAREGETMQYLESRRFGKSDWIAFHPQPNDDSIGALKKLGVDFARPCVGLLTNVAWDAQLHYGATPFRDMFEWLLETIAYFAKRPELQLLIRVHPAELTGFVKSRQPAVSEIAKRFPELPPNVFVIPPESTISTYDAMSQCDSVIIYATKTGIELAARGMPIIVAGEAWIRNKGFALDARSKADYFALLDRLPLQQRLDSGATTRARKYAYHFFFRRMIPVDFLDGKLRPEINSIRDLLPGRSPGLDVICDGVLEGTGFVYAAEDQASLEARATA